MVLCCTKCKKQVEDLYQGKDSVAVYYTKMKRFWDELADLSEIPMCACDKTCEAIKKTTELAQRQKLMQ